jgi:raffinose/stachyose/melibiose transport system substrate-binding protein
MVVFLCLALGLSVGFAAGTTEVKDAKVTLSVLDGFIPGEGMTIAWKATLKDFQTAHPNVVIDEETISNADLTIKVQTLAAADELPDIFCLKGQMAENFVKNEKVLSLSEFLEQDPEWKASFKEGVFSNFTFGGNIYAIPYQVTNTCIFYNKAIFDAAGITEFPTTWDQLISVSKILKAKGYTPIVLGNKEKWNAESVIMSTLGNRVTGNDWYESIRFRTGAAFTDPEFVQALKALSDLAQAGAFNSDVNSIDGAQQRQVFMNGKAAMTIDGTWAVAELDANTPDDVLQNIRIAALPAVHGGKGDPNAISGGSGWGLAVNRNLPEAKKEIVRAFLRTVLSTKFATMQAASGLPTAQKTDPFTLADNQLVAKRFNEFQQGRPYVPVYDHQLPSGVIQVMQAGLQNLLIGTITPEQLAADIQAEYQK